MASQVSQTEAVQQHSTQNPAAWGGRKKGDVSSVIADKLLWNFVLK